MNNIGNKAEVWQSDTLSNNLYIKCMYFVVNCHLASDWYAYTELERISRRIAWFFVLFLKRHDQSYGNCCSTFFIQWQWQNLLLSINLSYRRHVVLISFFSCSTCVLDYWFRCMISCHFRHLHSMVLRMYNGLPIVA